MATASCGKIGRASEEIEVEGNSEEMGDSGGTTDGVVVVETIAADVGRVNVDECVRAMGKCRETNSLLRCRYAVVEDGF